MVRGGLVAGGLQGVLAVQQGVTQQGPAAAAGGRGGGGGGGCGSGRVVLPRGPDTDYWHCRLKQ